jgi:hypothetical protein
MRRLSSVRSRVCWKISQLQLLADAQPVLAEGLLGADAFGVGFEVASQVRPADLATTDGQMVVGPPAI